MLTGKSISYKNSNLFYRTGGEGKSLVLLHGFCEDGNIWNDLAETLQKTFYIIIPDIPGSGKSGILKEHQHTVLTPAEQGKQSGISISIDDYAESVNFILDAEFIDACCMIGHSMGGYITLAFAEKYPERLNGLGLFHSSVFADDEEKIQTRLKAIDFLKNNGSHAYLKTSIPGLFTENFIKENFNEVEKLINAGKNFTADALIQYLEAMRMRPDRSEILKEFTKPVLMIAGEYDKAVPLHISLKQSHIPKISRFHILSNTAHMGMLEEKEKSESYIVEFLNNLNTQN